MNFQSKPSLADNAAFKVAVHLWYHVDIFRLFNEEAELMVEVIEHLRTLPISETLKRSIANCLGPLKTYLCNWLHEQVCSRRIPLYNLNWQKVLCWTSNRTIDCRRTAEKVLSYGILDTASAFRFACFNCLEHQIIKLWPEVHASLWQERPDNLLNDFMLEEEVKFWICYFSNRVKKWMRSVTEGGSCSKSDIFRYAFQCGINHANKEFGYYFVKKLDESDELETVERGAEFMLADNFSECDPDLFLLTLSHLDDDDKTELFQRHPRNALTIFLRWPLTHYFLDIAEVVFDSIDPEDYFAVVEAISSYTLEYVDNPMFECTFLEFWNRTPIILREYVVSVWIFGKYFNVVFTSDTPIIKSLVESSKIPEKLLKQMVSNPSIVLDALKGDCYWNTLEDIIAKYLPLEPHTNRFLRAIKDQKLDHVCRLMCNKNRFKENIFDILFGADTGSILEADFETDSELFETDFETDSELFESDYEGSSGTDMD